MKLINKLRRARWERNRQLIKTGVAIGLKVGFKAGEMVALDVPVILGANPGLDKQIDEALERIGGK